MSITNIITNPLVLLFFSIVLGQFLGKLEYKSFKLGSSGGLFVGIVLSYMVTELINQNGTIVLNNPLIPRELFLLSLIGFIASVGLIAAKKIKETIKKNGLKFMFLGFVVTLTGALSTLLFTRVFATANSSIIGTYVGALTSSPGLATALEMAKTAGNNSEALVGLGYSISYIPGVVIVILLVQFLGKRYLKAGLSTNHDSETTVVDSSRYSFDLAAFGLVCLIGILLGKVKINLGSFIGDFSLGSTGGVLIAALALGELKKVGSLNFNMDTKSLSVIRDMSLNLFLTTVGLNYGHNAISLLRTTGMQLLLLGLVTGILSIMLGYLAGKYLLKLETADLIGGICGGMTSTPGLAASIETLRSDQVVVGYGATYPFALFFMILFTNILFKL